MIPVIAALPVVCRTNQGTAVIVITLPVSEIAFAPNTTNRGAARGLGGSGEGAFIAEP